MPAPFVAHQLYPQPAGSPPAQKVARRHVIYIQGFFPQGSPYYHGLLRKQLAHHAQLYGVAVTCSDLEQSAPLVRRCEIAAETEDGSVHTVYDFLDWEDIISRAHSRSWFYDVTRAVRTFVLHFTDGTFAVMLRLFWKFAVAWILPYLVFAAMAASVALALMGAYAVFTDGMEALPLVRIVAGALAAFGLWRLSRLYWCASMIRSFNYAMDYAKGRAPELERRCEEFGQAIAETCRASGADEILIVGHSFGSQLAVRAAAAAWRRGAFAGNAGRVKLLTFGDATCHIGLMRGEGAARLRALLYELARQKDLPWQLLYSGKDAMGFNDVDPPSACRQLDGDAGSRVEDFNFPFMADIRLRSMLSEKDYRRMRWRFFHLHGLFIMAARLKGAHFDYMRAVCGARPLVLSGQRISAK